MKKSLICSVVLSFVGLGQVAATPFSHIVVFGDSLSDTGNFPTHALPFKDLKKGFVENNLVDNYTIAVSNPVNTKGKKIDWSLWTGEKDLNTWPPLLQQSPSYREKSPLRWPIHKTQRTENSATWALFLGQYAAAKKLIPLNTMISSRYLPFLPKRLHSQQNNVNYAYASALLNPGCYNISYRPQNLHCSQESIRASVKRYNHTSLKTRAEIEIPGIEQQIDFFTQDCKNGLTTHDAKTLYIVWGGGNNLISNLKNIENHHIMRGLAGFWSGINNRLNHVVERLAAPPINAKTIYVLDVYSPGLTPRYAHSNWFLRTMLNSVVSHFNRGIRSGIKKLRKAHPHINIQLIPVSQWITAAVKSKSALTMEIFARNKQGLACQMDARKHHQEYSHEPTPKDNCWGYMFWNEVHPSMTTHQYLAFKILQSLENTALPPLIT